MTLNSLNYQVTSVEDGYQAWDKITDPESDFDLILLDLELPGMDGLEVLAKIKETELFRNIPVVMCSAHDEMERVYKCIDLGAFNYMVKPIKPAQVQIVVEELKQNARVNSPIAESSLNAYELVKNLGKGGYAVVDLIRHKQTGELFAIKRVDLANLSDKERFNAENEATLLKVLGGPTIIRFVDQFIDNKFLYIIMEYAQEGTLSDVLKKYKISKQKVTKEQALTWLSQMLLAIMLMHSKNILHRDLKTQNIFMITNDYIKVGDMGISKSLTSSMELASTLAGTPFSMSPEVFKRDKYGPKTDIWSLGCVLYEITTFRRPFEEGNLESLEESVKNAEFTPISNDVDVNLRMFINQMLDKDPHKRPDAWELANNPIIKQSIFDYANEHDYTDMVMALFELDPKARRSVGPIAPSIIDAMTIASMARGSITLTDKKVGWFGKVETKTFEGNELLTYIQNEMHYSYEDALKNANEILGTGLINCIEGDTINFDPSKFYKFREDREDLAKNTIFPWKGGVREPHVICTNLINQLNSMLALGGNFSELKTSQAYREFLRALGEIKRVEIKSQSFVYKVEFFLNIYQIMLVHQMIEIPEAKAGWFSDPSNMFFYDFNGENFTLKDIKHGVLRGNKKPPSAYTRMFSNNDPRNILPGFNDPRILLVCKDPPYFLNRIIDFYQQSDPALEEVASAFCNREVCLNIPVEEFVLSSLLKDYLADFGGTEEAMIKWVLNYYKNCNISHEKIMKLIRDQSLFLHYQNFE